MGAIIFMSLPSASTFNWSGIFKPHDGRLETLQAQFHWTFRVTAALCFIGHGAWGVITKSGWLPFFQSQGIEPGIAWKLQPLIGAFDVLMALVLLWKPRRIVVMWMFLWGLWTAILRPLAGNLKKEQVDGEWVVSLATDSMHVPKMQTWEFWERAGNWGPPFLLLLMAGGFVMSRKDWLGAYVEPAMTAAKANTIWWLSRFCVGALMVGHAGFGFGVKKQMLIDHWQAVGVDADVSTIVAIGWAELALGFLVFLLPLRPIVWLVLVWKLFTEFLYVPADTVTGKGLLNIFEWIERWGDYGLPLAMLFFIGWRKARTAPKDPAVA
ncbi:hypothetical protein HAHE_35820 [Haloferula helveola]|uniref:DoxX family protein n=2 Tax=Haloferula helveola TaxID=490095 RepID=A0ABM7RDD2_9BACT|nr:hypothetical protein HAHE_35820 [Haloferula helveola]